MSQFNKILTTVFIFLLTIQVNNSCIGQTIGKNIKYYNYPNKYLNDPDMTILPNSTLDTKPFDPWVVYSDRSNIISYTSSTGVTPTNEKINIMHPFYVIGESGDYLRLAECNADIQGRIDTKNGYLPADTKDYGWVNKKYLLLWEKALVAQQTGVTIKALSVINEIDVLKAKNIQTYLNNPESDSTNLKVFDDPELTMENLSQVHLADFLFVFKKDPETGNYLVAYNYIFGFRDPQVILGWVSKSSMTLWTDRVCLEPNWDPLYAKNRRDRKLKCSLFTNEADATAYYSGNTPEDTAIWDNDTYTHRMDPNEKRFPVLTGNFYDNPSGSIKTGFVTPIFDVTGKQVLSVGDQDTIVAVYNKLREKASSFNIVFVMDGAPGGGNTYIKYVSNSINKFVNDMNGMNNLGGENTFKFKYGAVVYRDASQSACGKDYESTPLTTNNEDLLDWLGKTLNQQVTCTDGDPDHQALYTGLQQGLNLFTQGTNGQVNLIVIIGNQSDSKTTPSADLEKIKQKALKSNAEFIAIEPNGEDKQFLIQIKDLALYESKNIDSLDHGDRMIHYSPSKVPKFYPKAYPNKSIWSLKSPDESPIYAYITIANANSYLGDNDFTSSLDTSLNQIIGDQIKTLQWLDNKIAGVGTKEQPLNARFARYMRQLNQMEGIETKALSQYRNTNFQFFGRAYCRRDGPSCPQMFKVVILMTETEFAQLQTTFAEFEGTSIGSGLRTELITAWQQVLKSYYGTENKKTIDKLEKQDSFADLTTLVTRLPVTNQNSILKKYHLSDLKSGKISDQDINKIANTLEEYYKNLVNADQNNNIVHFSYTGGRYVWVSQDILP